MNQQILMNVVDAAKAMGISERTIWTLTQRHSLPCVRIGRRVLYDPLDLQKWIDMQKITKPKQMIESDGT